MASEQGQVKANLLWTKDFILVTFINLFLFLGFQMHMPVLPVYAAELGGSNASAGMVVGFFTISSVVMRPLAGRLLDLKGRKVVLLAGLILFIACVLSYRWVGTVFALLALRLLHGLGWGAAGTATSTIATDIIPKSRLGEGMGYFGMMSTLAMAIAPALGLSIMSQYGFAAVFDTSAAAVLLALLIAFFLRSQTPLHIVEQTKGLGSMIERSALLATGLIFFVSMTYGAVVTFIALYAQQRGISNIGLFFTVYSAALFISRPLFGRLADQKGPGLVILPGILAFVIAMLAIYFAETLTGFLVAGVVYGLGFGAVQPALMAMAVSDVKPARRGAANATFFTGFDLGIGSGSMIWGLVAAWTDYQTIYLLAVIPLVIAAVIFFKHTRSSKTSLQ